MNIKDTVKQIGQVFGGFIKPNAKGAGESVEEKSYPDDILAVCNDIPSLFASYQGQIADQKMSAALNLAYINGCVEMDIQRKKNETNYTQIWGEDKYKRGIRNYTDNRLIDPYRWLLTSMIQGLPKYEVFSAQSGDNTRAGIAKICTELLKYHDERIYNYRKKYADLFSFAIVGGTAYRELLIEESPLTYERAEKDGEQLIVKDGKAINKAGETVDAQISKVKQTRLQIASRTYWDVASSMDSDTGMIDDDTFHIIKTVKSIRSLKKYDKKTVEEYAKELPPKTAAIVSEQKKQLGEAMGVSAPGSVAILTDDDRQVEVYNTFYKGGGTYGSGWYAVVLSSGKPVHFEAKLPAGVMPLIQVDTNNSRPGDRTQPSVLDNARGQQVKRQAISNSLFNSMLLAANPPEIRHKGVLTTTDKKKRTDVYPKHGETRSVSFEGQMLEAVTANPGLAKVFEPHFQDPPAIPGEVNAVLQDIDRNILDVTGQSLANAGSLPNNNLSGVSVQEQVSVDQTSNLPLLNNLNDFFYRAKMQELRAIRNVYTTDQISFMLAETDVRPVENFKTNDMDDSYDIRLITAEGMPPDPQGKVRYYSSLMGIAPTDAEKMKLWDKIGEVLSGVGLVDDKDIDTELAKAETQRMVEDTKLLTAMTELIDAVDPQTGAVVKVSKAQKIVESWVNPAQDDLKHKKQHRPYLAGKEMLEVGPGVAQLFAWHDRAHEINYMSKGVQNGQPGTKLPQPGVPGQPAPEAGLQA